MDCYVPSVTKAPNHSTECSVRRDAQNELPFHFMLNEVGGRQGRWVDALRKLAGSNGGKRMWLVVSIPCECTSYWRRASTSRDRAYSETTTRTDGT